MGLIFLVWGWAPQAPHWHEIVLLLTGGKLDDVDRFILLQLRLPRIVLGAVSGMMLALAGLVLQGLFRNPLMDPFIIGVSGGGALGAGIAIVLGLDYWWYGFSAISLFALVGAMAVVVLVYWLGQYRGQLVLDRLLLAGVAMSAMSSSALAFFLVLKGRDFEQVVFWIMGSLAAKSWQDLASLIPFFVMGLPLVLISLHALNIMQTGEETALSLGLRVERSKYLLLLAATLLSAAVVSVCGVIGFVGLMVPHMARLLKGSGDFRELLIPCLILGALLLVGADAVARNMLSDREIPVGIFTALLGVPFFLAQLKHSQDVT